MHFAENTDNKKTKMLFQGNSEQKQETKHFWGNSSHFLAEKKTNVQSQPLVDEPQLLD